MKQEVTGRKRRKGNEDEYLEDSFGDDDEDQYWNTARNEQAFSLLLVISS